MLAARVCDSESRPVNTRQMIEGIQKLESVQFRSINNGQRIKLPIYVEKSRQ